MLNSSFHKLCFVSLPFASRQCYMHSFDLSNPVMKKGYEDYLQPVIDLCKAAGAFVGIAHMTVDEKVILAGNSQRKPKPHVDGCFIPSKMMWGHGGWNHSCNIIPERMAVIVASTVSGCRVWEGQFDGSPKQDGDLSHLVLGEGEILKENIGYLLSPDCVHESLVFPVNTQRTFLRIALPIGE